MGRLARAGGRLRSQARRHHLTRGGAKTAAHSQQEDRDREAVCLLAGLFIGLLGASLGRTEPKHCPIPKRRNPALGRDSAKRLKGFEPSTFCMASRRSSQLSYSRIFVNLALSLAVPRRSLVWSQWAGHPKNRPSAYSCLNEPVLAWRRRRKDSGPKTAPSSAQKPGQPHATVEIAAAKRFPIDPPPTWDELDEQKKPVRRATPGGVRLPSNRPKSDEQVNVHCVHQQSSCRSRAGPSPSSADRFVKLATRTLSAPAQTHLNQASTVVQLSGTPPQRLSELVSLHRMRVVGISRFLPPQFRNNSTSGL
jgi:hypothetical protein